MRLVVAAQPGERVLDLCASPGGKTDAMAADMREAGLVVASDVRPRRLSLLRDTVRASGASHVHIVHLARAADLPFAPLFDRVLVDAPCSGLGTIRRDPDIRWRRHEARSPSSRAHSARAARTRGRARPAGGRLVYATCSSEPEENEEVVDAFLAGIAEFELVDLRADGGAAARPLLNERGMMHTLPFAHGSKRSSPRRSCALKRREPEPSRDQRLHGTILPMPLKARVWSLGKLLLLAGALAATFFVFALVAMRVALRAREVQVPDWSAHRRPRLSDGGGSRTGAQSRSESARRRASRRRQRPPTGSPSGSRHPAAAHDPRLGQFRPANDDHAGPRRANRANRAPARRRRRHRDRRRLRIPFARLSCRRRRLAGSLARVPAPRVSLLLNRGEQAITYVMPDVIGVSGERAAEALRTRGFRVSIVGSQPYQGVPAGHRRAAAAGRRVSGRPVGFDFTRGEPVTQSGVQIAPSILSADFAHLGRDIAAVERGGADLIHVDVMDGHFVPNITIGPPVVRAIKKVATRPLDVHLMIAEPDRYIDDFADAGADMLSVHVEVTPHLHRTIAHIKSRGVKAGAVINPSTPVAALDDIAGDLDFVLVMSVNPGFGGQAFIRHSLDKVRRVREMLGRDRIFRADRDRRRHRSR